MHSARLSFQSSELGPPTPSPARECCSSPLWAQGGDTLAYGERGRRDSILTKGQILWYSMSVYHNSSTVHGPPSLRSPASLDLDARLVLLSLSSLINLFKSVKHSLEVLPAPCASCPVYFLRRAWTRAGRETPVVPWTAAASHRWRLSTESASPGPAHAQTF
jgi:hypothetical protein